MTGIILILGVLLGLSTSVQAQTSVEQRGELRIINRANVAVRVVITLRSQPARSFYWEYGPNEGSNRVLHLQTAGKPLQLVQGDAVAAFTTSGPARAWGPFIAGRSAALVWEERTRTWILALSRDPIKNVGKAVGTGAALRVGNGTTIPVRVVLTKADSTLQGAYWDLAPLQGSPEGQELAWAGSGVRIGEGDVFFVFATDSSRRYWGPNIIGFTPAPFWNARRRFWSTLVRP